MKTYNLAILTKRLMETELSFFDLASLKNLLEIDRTSSLIKVVKRLLDSGIIDRIERDKYIRSDYSGSPFRIANFLYQPSYISFESALSNYGILSQFPIEVTSATTKLTKKKEIYSQIFSYYRIQPSLYWGYVKKDNYLIAEPEKALLDQAYLATKGLKPFALGDFDLTQIEKKKLNSYKREFPRNVIRFFNKNIR